MSILMVALTAGFAAGSFIRKFPFSDVVIGIYAVSSLLILINTPNIPEVLFMVLSCGMGFLAAAQFVTRKPDSWSRLYAADLAGGVIGMMLGSTVLIPYFGIEAIAIGMGIIKVSSAITARFR
jgi:hypothetical protein